MAGITVPASVSVGDPTKVSDQNLVITALSDLDSAISAIETTGIPNSNFENDDGGSPAEPNNWTFTDLNAASHTLITGSSSLSGTQSIQLTTTSAAADQVSMESDRVKGGHIALDISFIYKTTATRDRFRVQLLEYNAASGGSLISTLTIADYAAGANISQRATGIDVNGLVGNSTYYTLKFILGDAGSTTTAGSVDIDAINVVSRGDELSVKQLERLVDTLSARTPRVYLDAGYIYLPSGTTSVGFNIHALSTTTAMKIDTVTGTTVAQNTSGTSTVTVTSLTRPGIYKFTFDGAQGGYTEFVYTEGFRTGITFTP